MSELIAKGNYSAKIIDYTIQETSKGDPMVVVAFRVEREEGGNVYWNGWFGAPAKDGGRNYSMESLIRMGMTSFDQFPKLVDGPDSRVLNDNILYNIEVDHESYEGKVRAKVKYINLPGSGFRNKMDSGNVKLKIAVLKGDFASAWREVSPNQTQVARPTASRPVEEIPF